MTKRDREAIYLHFSSFETRLHLQRRATTTASSDAAYGAFVFLVSRSLRGLEEEKVQESGEEREKAYGGFKDGVGREGPGTFGDQGGPEHLYIHKRDAGRERVVASGSGRVRCR